MNNDLISRKALKEKLTDTINVNDITKSEWYEGYASCVQVLSELIDNAPTVELVNDSQRLVKELVKDEWIPVSEKMPDNETEVLIQYGQSIMVGYHMWDFTMYPSEFADENETGWYDSKDDFICGSDEVTAWRPLPEPYKKGSAE